jgi:hypothetical protein
MLMDSVFLCRRRLLPRYSTELNGDLNMKELNVTQTEQVQGGIFINPVTVMVAVRVGQIAAPYLQAGAIAAVSAAAGVFGYEMAQ